MHSYCLKCGEKRIEEYMYCGYCGEQFPEMTSEENSDVKEQDQEESHINPKESRELVSLSSSKLRKQRIKSLAGNLGITIVMLYFYSLLSGYMDEMGNKVGVYARLFLMTMGFIYIIFHNNKHYSRAIWLPGLISILLSINTFTHYIYFQDYIEWTKMQGFQTQARVDPSAGVVLISYFLVYIAFTISVFIEFLKKNKMKKLTQEI